MVAVENPRGYQIGRGGGRILMRDGSCMESGCESEMEIKETDENPRLAK